MEHPRHTPENSQDVLSPAYWDNHGSEDACETTSISLHQMATQLERAQNPRMEQLIGARISKSRELLLLAGPNAEFVPLATFKKGSIFLLDQYPNDTIVRISSEVLTTTTDSGMPDYSSTHMLGVIADLSGITKNGGKMIVHILPSGILIAGPSTDIAVGEVHHTKNIQDSDQQIEFLTRTTEIDVVSVGGGIKQKEFTSTSAPLSIWTKLFPRLGGARS